MTEFIPSATMFAGIGLEVCDFRLVTRQEASRSASGMARVKDLGPALWEATFGTVPLTHVEASALHARLNALDGGLGAFEAHDVKRPHPALYTAATTPLAAEIGELSASNARRLKVRNLPIAFDLAPGDYLAFDYGAGTARALHQIVYGGRAFGDGISPWLDVRPYIRPGAVVGAPVTLLRPAARFNLVPDSISISRASRIRDRVSWSAVQEIIE